MTEPERYDWFTELVLLFLCAAIDEYVARPLPEPEPEPQPEPQPEPETPWADCIREVAMCIEPEREATREAEARALRMSALWWPAARKSETPCA